MIECRSKQISKELSGSVTPYYIRRGRYSYQLFYLPYNPFNDCPVNLSCLYNDRRYCFPVYESTDSTDKIHEKIKSAISFLLHDDEDIVIAWFARERLEQITSWKIQFSC
jgi:hypothetical protein